LAERSSRFVKKKLISENGYYFLFPPQGRPPDRFSLLHTAGTNREQFGNNLGTDMLAQYGDFGTY
jgi:hypothetical protein